MRPARTETVYAVSQGEYSDYRVLSIYERKADAQAEVDRLNAATPRYDEAFIEEFDWHPASGPPLDMEVQVPDEGPA